MACGSRTLGQEALDSCNDGMKNCTPRIRMLDGFNEGWIEFEGGASGSRKGTVQIVAALRDVVAGQSS